MKIAPSFKNLICFKIENLLHDLLTLRHAFRCIAFFWGDTAYSTHVLGKIFWNVFQIQYWLMYKFYKFSINTTIVLLKKKKFCEGLFFKNYQLSKYIQGIRWKQMGLRRRRPRWTEVKGIEFLGSLGSWYCYWVFFFFVVVFCWVCLCEE